MYIPFWVLYIAIILAGGWFLYEAGDLVLTMWDRHQYKKRATKAAQWLGSWGP